MQTAIRSRFSLLELFLMFSIVIAFFLYTPPARSQGQQQGFQQQAGPVDLIVKTGSNEKNVYNITFSEIQRVCPSPATEGRISHGSIESLNDLLNNKANLVYVQPDVILGRKTIDNDARVDSVRVFMPLYFSELHVIGNRSNQRVNVFSDLAGKKVGAYGGAVITARILFGRTNLKPFSLQEYTNPGDGLKAIAAGQIDAFFWVTGQPTPEVEALPGNTYKLIAFDRYGDLQKMAENPYATANLDYSNLSSSGVKTVSMQILMATYDYKSQKKITDLSALKKCIVEHYDDIKEETGNHPKWREINPNATSVWPPMFAFQGVSNSPKPAAKKSGKK